MAGAEEEQERGRNGVEMSAEPITFGICGAEATMSIRTPLEPMVHQTREAIAHRLAKLDAGTKAATDMEYMDRQWYSFDCALDIVNAIENQATREALLDGISAALSLGFLHRGGRKLSREAVDEAIEASRTPKEFRGIVENYTFTLRRKLFYRMAGATTVAGQIWATVSRDFDKPLRSTSELQTAFKRWAAYYRLQPPLANRSPTDETVKNFKDAIRKVIERADKGRSSG